MLAERAWSRRSRRVGIRLLFALGAPLACSTEDPIEHYFPAQVGDNNSVSTAQGGSGSSGDSLTSSGSGGTEPHGGAGDAGAAGQVSSSGDPTRTSASSGGTGGTLGTGGTGGTGGSGSQPVDCGPAPTSTLPFTKERLRAAAADCAVHQYCVFESHATQLENSVAEYAAEPNETSLAEAQSAWKKAMQSWQVLEVFQFGPLASPSASAGKDGFQGKGVRDKIYAWPTVARCRVDEQVIDRSFIERGLDGALISGRGLYALEALLFYTGTDSACGASSTTAEAWQALGATSVAQYKRDYALAVSEDVVDQMHALSATWSSGDAGFYQQFVSASGYPSEQEAMNVLAWALVYVEKEVKDYKLGMPAGYTLVAPVNEPEAPYAGVGNDNIAQNLIGFRSLFQGCGENGTGLGFDDWLTEAGHAKLAEDITSAWQTAFESAKNLPPLSEAPAPTLDRAYLDVKALTDLLKNELLGTGSPLNLDLPDSVAGDTD